MRFKDIQGLDEVKSRLIQSVKKDQLPHAMLLSGDKGSMNLPMALAFATYLNCQNRGEKDACGECAACVKNEKFIHPDLNFVFPVTPKAGVKPKDVVSRTFLEPWRQFLIERPFDTEDTWATYLGSEDKQFNISKEESRQIISNLSLKAFEGEFKIMLIWLPEYMNASSANGILKILEEPSDKTVFLLVSNDREKLLSTILSRVLSIHVRKSTNAEIQEVLENEHGVETSKASRISRLAEGNLAHALHLVDSGTQESDMNFRDWLLACHQFQRADLVAFADQFNSLNKLAQRSFLQYGNSLLREVLVFRSGAEDVQRTSPNEHDFVSKLAKQVGEERLEKLYNLFGETQYYLERNANPRIAFMDLSVQIAKVFRTK